MQFDVTWLLLLIPATFVLGWLASRFDFRQLQLQNRRSPKAYFRGLNHLLKGEDDAAVADFEQAVRNDPDTPELQFALGHLFRERGQYNPAVRLHEHLLMRADLSPAERQRAQHALAMDYTRAGILDRAEQALTRLEGSPHETQSRQIRLAIYERLRDWPHAAQVAQLLQREQAALYTRRLTHYACEQALQAPHWEQSIAQLQQARARDPHAPRPLVELARLYTQAGMGEHAAQVFTTLESAHPEWLALLAHAFVQLWISPSNPLKPHINLPEQLQKLYQQQPNTDLLEALVTLLAADPTTATHSTHSSSDTTAPPAADYYLQHLRSKPSLVAAARWLESKAQTMHSLLPPEVVQALEKTAQPLLRYRCTSCGFEGERHYWHCPGCQAWDAYPPLRIGDF